MPPGFVVYATAKAAMERFSSALAPELREHRIVNALRPGAVKTEQSVHELGDDYDFSGWGTPADVVPAAAFLADQIGTDFTGRVVDSTQFGVTWPDPPT